VKFCLDLRKNVGDSPIEYAEFLLVFAIFRFWKYDLYTFCRLPYLRCKGAQEEGFHNTFEEKENRQEVELKWQFKNQK